MKRFVLGFAMALVAGSGHAGRADTLLYDNGAINGTIGAAGFGYFHQSISDSFTLGTSATLTQAQVGLWDIIPTGPYPFPTSVDWTIGTSAFGTDVGSGTGNLLQGAFVGYGLGNPDYLMYEYTFPLTGSLSAGTYWLTLTASGSGAHWDFTDGPSSAFLRTPLLTTATDSESFQIYGQSADAATTPAPSTLVMSSILLGMIAVGWRFKRLGTASKT